MTLLARALAAAIRFYQLGVAPYLGTNCRFTPGCSSYALEAIGTHGAFRGTWLALRRLARCHPWGGSGYDPVPPTKTTSTETMGCSHRGHRHLDASAG